VPTPVAAPTEADANVSDPGGDSVPLGAGTVVQTLATDGLRMRSRPSTDADSFKYSPLLPLATPLLILDGPVSGSGYEWYDVAPLVGMEPAHGWVASGGGEGDAWIAPSAFACPAAPTDMRSLLDLPEGVGVLCFPNQPITVTARLISCNCDVDGAWYTPEWFAAGGGNLLVEPERTSPPAEGADAMLLSVDPAGDVPADLPIGSVVEVTGVFDHPAASTCTMTEMDGKPEPSQGCRLDFAVTRMRTQEP
jgi:hypothetical protein